MKGRKRKRIGKHVLRRDMNCIPPDITIKEVRIYIIRLISPSFLVKILCSLSLWHLRHLSALVAVLKRRRHLPNKVNFNLSYSNWLIGDYATNIDLRIYILRRFNHHAIIALPSDSPEFSLVTLYRRLSHVIGVNIAQARSWSPTARILV